MTFSPGDIVIYTPSKRKYIVQDCYTIKFNGQNLELIDVNPVEKLKGDKLRSFKGFNAQHFTLTKTKQ